MSQDSGCPVAHDGVTAQGSESENPAIDSPTPKTGGRPHTNKDWWPNMLDLSVLHAHSPAGNPLDEGFSYSEEFQKLDLAELRRDIVGSSTPLRTGGRPTSATTAVCSSE